MAIKINNLVANNNGGAGISVPADADVEIGNAVLTGNGKDGIEIRDPPSLLKTLGLPANTPPHLVQEILGILARERGNQERELAIVTKSGLAEWLGASVDLYALHEALMKAVAVFGGPR